MSPDEKTIEEAERAGFDLSLVDSNLRLSFEQRALRHAAALAFALELREAGLKNAQPAPLAEPAR